MNLELGLTDHQINTQYAPLAVLSAHYQHQNMFKPLTEVVVTQKKRDFTPTDKLIQALLSVLAGCESQYAINVHLKHENSLAHVWHWDRFADQSGIARTLDTLTLKQIASLRTATTHIWRSCSRARAHDWRGYLWLDFDLSGLPCGKHAEHSTRGYFSGKKTSRDVN